MQKMLDAELDNHLEYDKYEHKDCLYVPIKDDLTSSKKAVYVVIGVDSEGYKDILGMWIDKTESGSFWSNVFEDLKERGIKDILYMSSDGKDI